MWRIVVVVCVLVSLVVASACVVAPLAPAGSTPENPGTGPAPVSSPSQTDPIPPPSPTQNPTPSVPKTVATITFENYVDGNGNDVFYGPYWKGQALTIQASHIITSVSLSLVRVGNPAGDIVVGIREVDENGYPEGDNLAEGRIPASSVTTSWSEYSWYSFDLGVGYPVVAGKTYAIVWEAPEADAINQMYFRINTNGAYPGGRVVGSSDGIQWTDMAMANGTWDAVFQEWGQAIETPSPTVALPALPTVGYISYWQFRQLSNVKLEYLTHLIWQGVEVTSSTDPTLYIPAGYPWSQISTAVAVGHAKGVKVLACLGGPWDSLALNEIWKSPQLRAQLIANLKNLVVTYHLDGIDVDNESDPDPALTSTFLAELYESLNPLGKIITMAMHPSSIDINPAAARYLDFISLMTYDMDGYPYHSTYEESVRWMNYWADAGIPKSKLLMGIPFYGRDSATGFYFYSSIVDKYNPGQGQNQVSDSSVAGGIIWWNGVDLVKKKVDSVKSAGFGGVMVYEVGLDKFDSRSLLLAIYNEMGQLP